MRVWISIAILAISLGSAKSESSRIVKVWNFTLPHGTLQIDLRLSSSGASSLGFRPYGQVPAAPIAEQIEPLKQVLAEMPNLGADPRKLSYLGTRLFEEDVVEKLAYACADSPEWRLSMHSKGKGKEELVITLLNQSGAYGPYNEAFKQYGIQVRVTEAEKVGLMRFSQVPARGNRDRANAKTLVPADAMLGMRFAPINAMDN